MKSFPTAPRSLQRLLVFARLPRLGDVKKRLAADIGDERSLSLYSAMLEDLLESIGDSDPEIAIEIAWTAEGSVDGQAARRAFGDRELIWQTGKDLGERLVVAFSERIIFHRSEKIIAIGVDDPSLTRDCIRNAFQLLDSCEWIAGPAGDGGYYLIGCRSASFHPSVFEKIAWGESTVFAQTEESVRALGSSLAILPERVDIDTAAGLEDYLTRFEEGAPRVRKLAREWGLHAPQ